MALIAPLDHHRPNLLLKKLAPLIRARNRSQHQHKPNGRNELEILHLPASTPLSHFPLPIPAAAARSTTSLVPYRYSRRQNTAESSPSTPPLPHPSSPLPQSHL